MTRLDRRIHRTARGTQWRRDRLLAALAQMADQTTRDLADAVGCSAHTCWGDLAAMQVDGLVTCVKARGLARWSLCS